MVVVTGPNSGCPQSPPYVALPVRTLAVEAFQVGTGVLKIFKNSVFSDHLVLPLGWVWAIIS